MNKVLHELLTEVQQLRREVNRLKSDRGSSRSEEYKGTLRRKFEQESGDAAPKRLAETDAANADDWIESRVRRGVRKNSADDNEPRESGWVEAIVDRPGVRGAVELEWTDEPPQESGDKPAAKKKGKKQPKKSIK